MGELPSGSIKLMSLQSTIFKLGKGFDTGSSEELTELCRLLRPDRRIVLRTMHSDSKSPQLETTAGSADARPAIQNRTGPLRFDCQRHDQHQWSVSQQDRGDHQVDEPSHLFSDPSSRLKRRNCRTPRIAGASRRIPRKTFTVIKHFSGFP